MSDRMTFFLSFVRAIDFGCKTDAEKGKIYTAIMHYAFYNNVQTLPEHLSALFELIKPVIDGAKERKKKRTKVEQCTEQCSNNVQTKAEQNFTLSLNDIHTPIPISNNSLSVSFSYPETVEDVLQIADKAGCVISRDEAQRYFICRMSADWVDAAGRKIAASRLGYDLKRWVLNAQKTQKNQPESKQREVKYEPSF